MEPNLEISGLITPLVNAYKALSNEWKHLMDIGIAEYLDSQTEKFYYTNTFLHRSEKVKFYDVYYPIKTSYKALTTDFDNAETIFEDYKNITIIGSAGSGKSTLMRHVFLETIKKKSRIPIIIELRNLNEYEGDLEKLIVDKILKSRIKPSDDTLKRALRSGSFFFLLDGYDEIFSNRREKIKNQIELFADNYYHNRFLMTTRPGSGIESFPRFHNFKICPLDHADITGFIDRMISTNERNLRIKTVINDSTNKNYVHYLGNPLLLSMFILAFESHPEIPNRKSAFYRNVFDTLYSKHDGITKNSFARERLTNLQREDFEEILGKFSYLTLCKGEYAFTNELLTDSLKKVRPSIDQQFKIEALIADLQTSVSILVLDGFEYKFPHRSMQEYFAAQFISSLPGEQKAKAYDTMGCAVDFSRTDGSPEFWELCYEQDAMYFLSMFVLPKLKTFAMRLDKKSDLELVKEFGNLWGIHLSSGSNDEIGVHLVSFPSLFTSFAEYYNFISGAEVSSFPKDPFLTKQLINLQFKFCENNIVEHLDAVLLEIMIALYNFNFASIVKKFRNNLIDKILTLEAEITRKTNDMDALLSSIKTTPY